MLVLELTFSCGAPARRVPLPATLGRADCPGAPLFVSKAQARVCASADGRSATLTCASATNATLVAPAPAAAAAHAPSRLRPGASCPLAPGDSFSLLATEPALARATLLLLAGGGGGGAPPARRAQYAGDGRRLGRRERQAMRKKAREAAAG